MKNKKELIERVEGMGGKDEDLKYYILISDAGVSLNANKIELCSLITSALCYCKDRGYIDDIEIDRICSLGKKDEQGLMDELLNEVIKHKKDKDINCIIDRIIKDMEEM